MGVLQARYPPAKLRISSRGVKLPDAHRPSQAECQQQGNAIEESEEQANDGANGKCKHACGAGSGEEGEALDRLGGQQVEEGADSKADKKQGAVDAAPQQAALPELPQTHR